MAADASPVAPRTLAPTYDGEPAAGLAARIGAVAVELYASVGSTMDAAHEFGRAGASAGTVVLADEQTAGRGRQGSAWLSAAGQGLWFTLLERPTDAGALQVLSLRVGLAAAEALDAFADAAVQVKWPNDLLIRGRKLAGVLVEVRWRGAQPDWVAIGVGVNVVRPQGLSRAAGLRHGVRRVDVLASLVPTVRSAATATGPLDQSELARFAARDFARGKPCLAPCPGVVAGVTKDGELAVETGLGLQYHRTGSLLLQEGA